MSNKTIGSILAVLAPMAMACWNESDQDAAAPDLEITETVRDSGEYSDPGVDSECEGDSSCGDGVCGPGEKVFDDDNSCDGGTDDGNDVPWDGCDEGQIVEFQVNDWTKGDQRTPDVASFPDGRYLVVWQGMTEGGAQQILCKMYLASGAEEGPEFQVTNAPTETEAIPRRPRVETLPDGGFVVVWEQCVVSKCGSEGGDLAMCDVLAQRFDAAAQKTGAATQINEAEAVSDEAPAVAVLKDGSIVVVWQKCDWSCCDDCAASPCKIMARFLDPGSDKPGSELVVSDGTDQYGAEVAAIADGRFVVVWAMRNAEPGGDDWDIFGQLVSPAGGKDGAYFRINTIVEGAQGNPAVAAFGGGFLVAWQRLGQGHASVQVFSTDGARVGGEVAATEDSDAWNGNPAVAALVDGRFIATWDAYGLGTTNVFARRFAPGGTKDGTVFPVNVFTKGEQSRARVATLGDSVYVIVWQSCPETTPLAEPQDGDGCGVFAQRFAADGTKLCP